MFQDSRLGGNKQHSFVFWFYLPTPDASFAATWKDSGSGKFHIGILVMPGGRIAEIEKDRTWARTGAKMPAAIWRRVRFDIDGGRLCCSVHVGGETLELVRTDISLPADQTYNILTLSPQAPEGGIVYLDDVLVTVSNPAQ